MEEYRNFIKQVTDEQERVAKVLRIETLDGFNKARQIYENHFEETYTHGVNLTAQIAKVNVLRRNKQQTELC